MKPQNFQALLLFLKKLHYTRSDVEFEDGWSSADRFETCGCAIAEILCGGGDVRPLLHFLLDVDIIASLDRVVVFIEAPLNWFNEWVTELEGELGHYLEPSYIKFKRSPKDPEVNRIEQIIDEEFGTLISTPGEEWESNENFYLGIFEHLSVGESESFLSLIEELRRVIPITVIASGVYVNLK